MLVLLSSAPIPPGCTVEACASRDDYSAYAKAGVVVPSVSPDSVESHKKFKARFNLPFPLLAAKNIGWPRPTAPGPRRNAPEDEMGILRTTFLIGADGRLVKVLEKVKPDGHSQEILGALPQT